MGLGVNQNLLFLSYRTLEKLLGFSSDQLAQRGGPFPLVIAETK